MSKASQNPVFEIVAHHKSGAPIGIYSVCSAHPLVLKAAMRQSIDDGSLLLVEATCNQVNQFGGYTGMRPVDFVDFVVGLAKTEGLPEDRLALGGDHLGPSPWQSEPAEAAMEKARVLVSDFVRSGYRKLHLDASMSCLGDPTPLPDEIVAERAAELCEVAESAYEEYPYPAGAPTYIVGTEVPPPGGAKDEETELHVTTPKEIRRTISTARKAFRNRGLEDAWNRVVGVVVQPGVEFGNDSVHHYQRASARDLSQTIDAYDGLVYEAHSTDYQMPAALRQLVEDHFCILKVGPWLTFAMREAIFALLSIEEELLGKATDRSRSGLRECLETAMLENPGYWKKYYSEDPAEAARERVFSFSDRIRYYWQRPTVETAFQKLMANLASGEIPMSLISQFLPEEFDAIREGKLGKDPTSIILNRIRKVLGYYSSACSGYNPAIID